MSRIPLLSCRATAGSRYISRHRTNIANINETPLQVHQKREAVMTSLFNIYRYVTPHHISQVSYPITSRSVSFQRIISFIIIQFIYTDKLILAWPLPFDECDTCLIAIFIEDLFHMSRPFLSAFSAMLLNQVSAVTYRISPHRMAFSRTPNSLINFTDSISATRARISFLSVAFITNIYPSWVHTTLLLGEVDQYLPPKRANCWPSLLYSIKPEAGYHVVERPC